MRASHGFGCCHTCTCPCARAHGGRGCSDAHNPKKPPPETPLVPGPSVFAFGLLFLFGRARGVLPTQERRARSPVRQVPAPVKGARAAAAGASSVRVVDLASLCSAGLDLDLTNETHTIVCHRPSTPTPLAGKDWPCLPSRRTAMAAGGCCFQFN